MLIASWAGAFLAKRTPLTEEGTVHVSPSRVRLSCLCIGRFAALALRRIETPSSSVASIRENRYSPASDERQRTRSLRATRICERGDLLEAGVARIAWEASQPGQRHRP